MLLDCLLSEENIFNRKTVWQAAYVAVEFNNISLILYQNNSEYEHRNSDRTKIYADKIVVLFCCCRCR